MRSSPTPTGGIDLLGIHPNGEGRFCKRNQQKKDSTHSQIEWVFCFRGRKLIERAGKMIISMKLHAAREEIDEVRKQVEHFGYKVHSIEGEERVVIGGAEFVVMAGPCSVESEKQIMQAAEGVAKAGAKMLRGGAFKPRTSPYDFQGMEEEGLRLLKKAKEATGLAIITEVMSDRDVDLVAKYADVMQVGARNMQNFMLLKALGKCGRPVLLKRGLSSTVKELLMSAEYITAHGNPDVILCERGIRTFETVTRNTCDIAAIPALNELTHLPVILDPSHATGRRSLVPALSRAGVAIGADGLIVEVHPAPEKAISDGAQSLDLAQFQKMMNELAPYIQLWNESRKREISSAAVAR